MWLLISRTILALWLASGVMASAQSASAQEYPSQPIRIIVALAPGGIADLLARAFATKLTEAGKLAIVENRTGGSGTVGAAAAAKSAPDGYTLYMGLHATQSILPHLMSQLPYDPAKDFAPIALVATSANVLIVHPSVPAKTAGGLVAYIRANPGRINFATPGIGSSGHLVGEQFRQAHNLVFSHVHYRGAGPALQDVVAGHVQAMFDIVALTKEQMESGRVRALAITSSKRDPVLPDVATMTEAGLPSLEGGPWFALFAPAGTPRPIIDILNDQARKAFAAPDLRSRLEAQGLNLALGSPEDLSRFVAADTARWGEVIKKGAIKMQ